MSTVETPGLPESPENHPADHAANAWMGHEFLVWLWFRIERDYGKIKVGELGEAEVWIEDRIVFRSPGEKGPTVDCKGGAPAQTEAARTALREGKWVEQVRLGLRIEDREYRFTLKGKDLQLTGLAFNEMTRDRGEAALFERTALMDELVQALELILKVYAGERIGDDWNSKLLPAIVNWIHYDQL